MALDESRHLTHLLSQLRTEWEGSYGKSDTPDPWAKYHKLKAPPGTTCPSDDSGLDGIFHNLNRRTCTDVPEHKAISKWLVPLEYDDEDIHIFLVHKGNFFSTSLPPFQHTQPYSAALLLLAPLSEVAEVFRNYKLPYTSDLITMHVAQLRSWKKTDVTDARNKIQLLWLRDDPVKRAPLDETRRKLDRTRSISDVSIRLIPVARI